ncbi:MAG: dockerin type I domain-containing protein, partial [Aureliella sp.]
GAEPEAVYVNSLWVTAGSTLDLGNLKLYARSITIESGAVVKGTYLQLPGGGSLPWEVPTAGTIDVTQPQHEWTFEGHAGGRFSLFVNPGSGVAPGPIAPLLNWARVRLFDSSGTLLATASSPTSGALASITDYVFPADGVYRAIVDAARNQPASTGNYLILARDTTPNRRVTNVVITSSQVQGIGYGNAIEFTVQVTPQASGTPAVTGAIQFQIDGANFGSAIPLFGGVAKQTVPLLNAGTHSISAIFTSDNGSFDTKTTTFTQVVSPVLLQVRATDLTRVAGSQLSLSAAYSGFISGEDARVLRGEPVFGVDALAQNTVGVYPISIARGSLAADNYAFQFVSGTMQVTAAPPARLEILSGANQSVIAQRALPVDFRIRVVDQFNNPVPGIQVTFAAPASGPSGSFAGGLSSVTVTTSDTGEAIAPKFTTNDIAGQYAITVTVGAIVTTFAVTNLAPGAPLELELNSTAMSEHAGVVSVTLRRNTVSTSALVVNLLSSNPSLVQVPASVSFPANVDTINFNITIVDDAIAQGDQAVTISCQAASLPESQASLTIVDDEIAALALQLDAATIQEGALISGTLARNTPTDSDLVVHLSSDRSALLSLPATVVIPAGQRSVRFDAQAVDDFFAGGLQSLGLTADARGLKSSTTALSISDNDAPAVQLQLVTGNAISENRGSATLRISRNTDTAQALAVQLRNSLPADLNVPATVTLPAGAAFADVLLSAVDNQLSTADRIATIDASSAGYQSASVALTIQEDDAPALSLVLDSSAISEKQGSTVATLTRNTSTASSLKVELGTDAVGRIFFPATVTIPAGAKDAHFVIASIDDQLLQGTQLATLTARHDAFADAVAQLSIEDDESLSISVKDLVVSEQGGSSTVRIVRNNSNIENPLTVSLASSGSAQVVVPPTVVIPAGEASISVVVTAVDDDALDGLRNAEIIASSAGYQSAAVSLAVSDYETLSVSAADPTIAESGGRTSVTITRSNLADMTSDLTVALSCSSPTQIVLPQSVVIPAGASSVSVDLVAVDNSVYAGDRKLTLTATATGYAAVPGTVTILEDEPAHVWLNAASPLDVNEDGHVTPLDVLLIINMINTSSSSLLGPVRQGPFVDCNGDDYVTGLDALLVINYLNTHLSGE